MQVNAQYDTTTIIDKEQPEPPPPEEEYNEEEESEDDSYFRDKNKEDSLLIIERNVSDSAIKALQGDDAFWYANAEFAKKKNEQKANTNYTPLGQQPWVKTLFWIIIVGVFAAVIMWYLADSNIGLFRKKNKIDKAAAEEEVETQDIFAINYQKEIDKATAQGNYRLAVRLMFLRLLKNMSEKNIINYKQDKTNFDYLLELHSTSYYKDFFRITRNYEYTWYGQFEINEEAYRIITNDFSQFEKSMLRS